MNQAEPQDQARPNILSTLGKRCKAKLLAAWDAVTHPDRACTRTHCAFLPALPPQAAMAANSILVAEGAQCTKTPRSCEKHAPRKHAEPFPHPAPSPPALPHPR